jgi:hypothetical protein
MSGGGGGGGSCFVSTVQTVLYSCTALDGDDCWWVRRVRFCVGFGFSAVAYCNEAFSDAKSRYLLLVYVGVTVSVRRTGQGRESV